MTYWFLKVVSDLKNCHGALETTLGKVSQMKDTVISLQEAKIENQEKLIKESNRAAVESFQSSLRNEIKTYWDVIVSSQTVTPQSIACAVKEVVQTEDRNRNIILYGVKEDDSGVSELSDVVSQVLRSIGEKQVTRSCTRLGKKNDTGKPRTIKVCCRSSDAALRLQKSGRRLKESEETN